MSETSAETAYPAPPAAPAAHVSGIADPAPLGLAAFAMTTFVLSLANANFYPLAGTAAISLALFYGGLGQLLAGMWEFKRGNTFGATAFSSYGAFWLAFWYLLTHNPGTSLTPTVVGTFLFAWTIFTGYMMIPTFKLNGALVTVFVLLFITFALLTIGAYNSKASVTHAGGWVGVLTALAAWYTSAAIVANDVFGKTVLPLMPLNG
jgi:uncharacterized protein